MREPRGLLASLWAWQPSRELRQRLDILMGGWLATCIAMLGIPEMFIVYTYLHLCSYGIDVTQYQMLQRTADLSATV